MTFCPLRLSHPGFLSDALASFIGGPAARTER